MRVIPFFLTLAALAATLAAGPAAAQAGNFSPVAIVNDRPITRYELDQRIRFLTLLRAPGDIGELALEVLIEDRLRMDAAAALGIALTDAQVLEGMTEFASRANLTAEQFVQALAQGGVAAETFRDFVEAGLVWREVVRARFGPTITVSEAEIDRALSDPNLRISGTRLLLSEILIPAPEGSAEAARALAAKIGERIDSEVEFEAAARRYSAAPTKARGGRLDWASAETLPPEVQAAVTRLSPGEVSAPAALPNGFAIYLLRQRESRPEGPMPESVDYAEFLIPGGRSAAALAEAAAVRARADTCDDLYGVAKGLPPERLRREVRTLSELAPDVAAELARLDPGESSTAIVRGDALVFLMLCIRNPVTNPAFAPSRDQVRTQLINQRLGALSDSYLAELRAGAYIRTP